MVNDDAIFNELHKIQENRELGVDLEGAKKDIFRALGNLETASRFINVYELDDILDQIKTVIMARKGAEDALEKLNEMLEDI